MSFYYARKKFPLQYTFLLYSMGRQGYRSGKGGMDLVQRRRKNKGRRGFVHQVKALGFGKRRGAWCKGDGRTRAGGDSCTKSKRPDLEKGGGTWCKGDGSTRAGGDSCTKSKRSDLEKGGGLGAKATEEQGLEGIHAPSQSARIWKKAGGLGAKATEVICSPYRRQ